MKAITTVLCLVILGGCEKNVNATVHDSERMRILTKELAEQVSETLDKKINEDFAWIPRPNGGEIVISNYVASQEGAMKIINTRVKQENLKGYDVKVTVKNRK